MNKSILLSCVCCSLTLSAFPVFANDKVQSTYDGNRYMQVCKGKTQGAPVSFAYRGIIWNGTCEPQFFPSNKSGITGAESELYTTCQGASGATSATINGREVRGKCALGYSAPQPK
jgi:hypothetical protein